MLFHELYSSYYNAAAFILRRAVAGNLTGRELNALIRTWGFGESALTIPEGLTGEKWRLLRRDLSTPIRKPPTMPLTTLEKRWMKALLLDPRIRLFQPDMTGLEDIEPLFTPDRIVYYDRYTDGDNYADPRYIACFRTILDALREQRNLFVRFATGAGASLQLALTPYCLEYSEKEDRFRLVAASRKRRWYVNLSRITFCEPAHAQEPMALRQPVTEEVILDIKDRRKALERVLMHFSHLEKETRRLDDTTYRLTLRYDKNDETEMVIRVLSFGPALRVVGPERFQTLIRERVEAQKRLYVDAPDKT